MKCLTTSRTMDKNYQLFYNQFINNYSIIPASFQPITSLGLPSINIIYSTPSLRNGMSSYPIINTNLLMEIHVLSYYSYKYFIHTVVMGSSVYSGCKRFCHTAVKLVSFFLAAVCFLMH